MAFDPQPDEWLANWSEDGVDISVPLATFPELTAAEADGTSGDIRKIVWAIAHELWQVWLGTPAVDRPGKMTFRRNTVVDGDTGNWIETYDFTFVLVPTGTEVAPE